MGATNEQTIYETDQITEEAIIAQEKEQTSPRYKLIGKLMRREIHLSYSKLKHLSSPINFIDAILNKKPRNAGMSLGSLVDCLLLTEDKFDEQYTVIDETPTTDKQTEFVDLVFKKMILEPISALDDKFAEAVSEGFGRVKTEQLKPYIIATLQGKECVSKADYAKAKTIVDNLKNTDEVTDELMLVEDFQKKLEFNYKGWNFICYLDTYFENGFHDLKFASDCNPEKFQRDIEKFGYDIQIGVYAIGFEALKGNFNPIVKHIVYDAIGNYVVLNIDGGYVNYCKQKVDFLIACLDKMISENGYNKSYNFFRPQNTVYKPRWAPGFDMTMFEK